MEGAALNAKNKRIALVTGGNKGIGLEICKQLASNGILVILTARDEKRGKEAVDKLIKEFGLTDVIFHQLDVTEISSIASLADFVKTQFGKLDILVNNAAIGGIDISKPTDGQLTLEDRRELVHKNHTVTYERAEECMKTNYYGTKHMVEAFLPLVESSSSGKIVNVSSTLGQLMNFSNEKLKEELQEIDNLTLERIDDLAKSFIKSFKENKLEENGWQASAGFSPYRLSKLLLNAYSRVLAKMRPALRINCVSPGYVATDLNFHTGFLTVTEGAEGPVMLALAEGGPTGLFYDRTQVSVF